MPTSRNFLVPSVLVKSGNVLPSGGGGAAANGSDVDIDLDEFITAQTFAPPGARPVRSGKLLTKTQAAAERKAEKEVKWKEAEGKNWRRLLAGSTPRIKNKKNSLRPLKRRLRRLWLKPRSLRINWTKPRS
jgi:hypothetical protein